MAIAQVPKSAIIVPRNMKVVSTNPLILKRVKTGRRGPKLSKKTRDRISATARRFKFPVLDFGANVFPIMGAVDWLQNDAFAPIDGQLKAARYWNKIMSWFFGVTIDAQTLKIKGEPRRLMFGAGSNLGLMFARRLGLTKSLNAKLTKSRIPISL